MEQRPFNKKRNNRRRRSKSRPRKEQKPFSDCPICSKGVRDLLTAIDYNEQPAHFECVLKAIESDEELEPKEKVIYLGGGSFGVVQFRKPNQGKLFIRRRIQFEEKEKKFDWRRKVSEHLKG